MSERAHTEHPPTCPTCGSDDPGKYAEPCSRSLFSHYQSDPFHRPAEEANQRLYERQKAEMDGLRREMLERIEMGAEQTRNLQKQAVESGVLPPEIGYGRCPTCKAVHPKDRGSIETEGGLWTCSDAWHDQRVDVAQQVAAAVLMMARAECDQAHSRLREVAARLRVERDRRDEAYDRLREVERERDRLRKAVIRARNDLRDIAGMCTDELSLPEIGTFAMDAVGRLSDTLALLHEQEANHD